MWPAKGHVSRGGVLDEGAGDELVTDQFGFVELWIGFVLVARPGFRRVVEEIAAGGLVLVDAGFEAGELPRGDGHLFDQDFLEATDGAVIDAEGLEKTFESMVVLARKEGGVGTTSVSEGVEAIGVDLFLSGHEKLRFGRRKPNRASGSPTNRLTGARDVGGDGNGELIEKRRERLWGDWVIVLAMTLWTGKRRGRKERYTAKWAVPCAGHS